MLKKIGQRFLCLGDFFTFFFVRVTGFDERVVVPWVSIRDQGFTSALLVKRSCTLGLLDQGFTDVFTGRKE